MVAGARDPAVRRRMVRPDMRRSTPPVRPTVAGLIRARHLALTERRTPVGAGVAEATAVVAVGAMVEVAVVVAKGCAIMHLFTSHPRRSSSPMS